MTKLWPPILAFTISSLLLFGPDSYALTSKQKIILSPDASVACDNYIQSLAPTARYDFSDDSTITASAAGLVSQVLDKSGSGYTLVQATDANKPRLTRADSAENTIANSSTFDNATYWTNGSETLAAAPAIPDPFGGTGAYSVLSANGVTARHQIYGPAANRYANGIGQVVLLSIYVQDKDNTQKMWFGWAPSGYDGAVINTNCTIQDVNNVTATATTVGSWCLVQVRYPTTASATAIAIGHTNSNTASNGPTSYLGDGKGFYIYGASIRTLYSAPNFVTTTTYPTFAGINNRKAFELDGSTQVLSNAGDIVGTVAATLLTVFRYAKPETANTGPRIIDNAKFGVYVVRSTGQLEITSDFTGGADSAAGSIADNSLNCVAVTRTASGVANIYINGALSGTANQASGTPATGSATKVFNSAAGTRGHRGYATDLILFNRVLSTAERVKAQRCLCVKRGISCS